MPATLGSLTTDLRYWKRDTDPVNPTIPTANYWSWINRAVRGVVQDTLFLEATTSFTPDGTHYYFTLNGTLASGAVAPDYLALKSVWHADGVIICPIELEEIQQAVADDCLVAGSPGRAALWANKIYFNAIPPASLILNFNYYRYPTDMSADGNAPDSPLDLCDGLILARAKRNYANDEGQVLLARDMEAIYQSELPRFQRLVNQKGKAMTGGQVPYRCL